MPGQSDKFVKFVFFLLTLALLLNIVPVRADHPMVKMVITSAYVSSDGLDVYQDIARYVGTKLGHDARVISDVSYDEANQLLAQGIIQVGFICGLPYTQQYARGNVQLVAIPVTAKAGGEFPDTDRFPYLPGKYYSYTIVHKDSPYQSWADIKGKRYVYNERFSNSGYNVPRHKLIQLGILRWLDYFAGIERSGSHEESIRMVARGQADASSVNSIVLNFMRSRGDKDALAVRIIDASPTGGAGAPPVVISQQADPALRDQLETIFVNMHKDPEGQAILQQAQLTRFIPADDGNYDLIREMQKAAYQAGFQDL